MSQGLTDMITVEVVQQRLFPDGSMEAARSAIRRLCGTNPENSLLQPEPLDGRRVYYRLTPLAAKMLGKQYIKPLRSLGRVRRYAVSWFIHAEHPQQRILFNLGDHAEHFGLKGHRFPHHPFFLDSTTDREKIGFILVDHNAQIRQTVQKTIKPLERFLRLGWFNDYIMAGSFVAAILTFSAARQRAIRVQVERAIQRRLGHALEPLRAQSSNRNLIEVLVTVIPGMEAVLIANQRTENHQ